MTVRDIEKTENKVFHGVPLAQSVERWTFNPTVKGSSPLWGVVSSGYNFCRYKRYFQHSTRGKYRVIA